MHPESEFVEPSRGFLVAGSPLALTWVLTECVAPVEVADVDPDPLAPRPGSTLCASKEAAIAEPPAGIESGNAAGTEKLASIDVGS